MKQRFGSLLDIAAFSACMLAWAGCDKATDGAAGGAGLTAKVDGEAWEADAIGIVAQALGSSPGCIQFSGTQSKGTISSSIIVTLYNVKDTGTYPLGTSLEVVGGLGQSGQSTGEGGGNANSWITAGTGLDGEVHITKVGAGHITAAFNFVSVPGKNNPLTVNRVITEGKVRTYDMGGKDSTLDVANAIANYAGT